MSKEYLEKRLLEEENIIYGSNLEEVERHIEVLKSSEVETKKIIRRYLLKLKENNISKNLEEVNTVLDKDELEELSWDYETYVKYAKKYEEVVDVLPKYAEQIDKALKNASLRHRVTKKVAMMLEIKMELSKLSNKRTGYLNEHLSNIANKTINSDMLPKLNNKVVPKLYSENFKSIQDAVNQRWVDNKNFSDRIWGDTERIIKKLEKKLPTYIGTGNIKAFIKDVSTEFNVSKLNAKRLILTESARIHNKARVKNYSDLGVEEVEILATLDLKTSNICINKDKSIVKLEHAKIGIDLPPFHPSCRSVFIPVLSQEIENIVEKHRESQATRIERDIETGKSVFSKDKNYKEYENKIIKKIPKIVKRTTLNDNIVKIIEKEFGKLKTNEVVLFEERLGHISE